MSLIVFHLQWDMISLGIISNGIHCTMLYLICIKTKKWNEEKLYFNVWYFFKIKMIFLGFDLFDHACFVLHGWGCELFSSAISVSLLYFRFVFFLIINLKLSFHCFTHSILFHESQLFVTVTVDEPAPGLKSIVSFKVPDQRSGKVRNWCLFPMLRSCIINLRKVGIQSLLLLPFY